MVYEYMFVVMPNNQNPRYKNCKALFQVFRLMSNRLCMEFTESEFNDFRDDLAKVGFELYEIERVPHLNSEPVK